MGMWMHIIPCYSKQKCWRAWQKLAPASVCSLFSEGNGRVYVESAQKELQRSSKPSARLDGHLLLCRSIRDYDDSFSEHLNSLYTRYVVLYWFTSGIVLSLLWKYPSRRRQFNTIPRDIWWRIIIETCYSEWCRVHWFLQFNAKMQWCEHDRRCGDILVKYLLIAFGTTITWMSIGVQIWVAF